MLDKLKTALVLVVIGAVAGVLIWGVHELTWETIRDNKIAREEGYYKEIFNLDEEDVITFTKTTVEEGLIVEEIVIYDENDALVGVIYKGETKNTYGDITVLIGVEVEGETITQVVISSTTNTPTFVKNLEKERKGDPSYLDNFMNQSIHDYTIDEKTGATYSYTSVTDMIHDAVTIFQESWGE